MLNKKFILITGGTGSFGHKFVEMLLARYESSRLVVFSRDKLKQYEMVKTFAAPCMRYFLGDVRDLPQRRRAFEGIVYAILPVSDAFSKQECCVAMKAQLVQSGFAYNSGTNTDFLSVEQLRSLIAQISPGLDAS